MKIEALQYPFVITDDGQRFHKDNVKGTPRIGATLTTDLEVIPASDATECVNGVCPIR